MSNQRINVAIAVDDQASAKVLAATVKTRLLMLGIADPTSEEVLAMTKAVVAKWQAQREQVAAEIDAEFTAVSPGVEVER